MLKPWVGFLILNVILPGCAHRGAMRVDCEGPLRQINRPANLKDAPVTVVPASPEAPASGEK
jgi:hypothetical protein